MKVLDQQEKERLQRQAREEKAAEDHRVVIDLEKLGGSDTWEQLAYLREFTKRTGMLHDAQVKQLKIWPRVLFQRSTASVVAIDIPDKKMVFKIVEASKSPKALPNAPIFDRKAAPGALDLNVKRMLGMDWDVTIEVTRGTKTTSYHYGPDFGRPEGLVVRVEARGSAKAGRKADNA